MKLSRERALLLAVALAALVIWWLAWGELARDLTITVLDVGQGDCVLVEAPGGRTMLIDGGGGSGQRSRGYDTGRDVVVPALMARRVRRLDVLVITHPHDDHVGGLEAVLQAVPVEMVLDPMLESDNDSYERVCREIERRGIAWHRATEGQRLRLGRGVRAEVLNPPDPRLRGTGSELNDNSVVLRLTYGGASVLLAADIDEVGARRMARLGPAVRSTVLKVPHHGSADPAVREFVGAVSPELAVISVGADNPFGHPSDEMVRELERVGAKIMTTAGDGAVTIRVRPPGWHARGSAGWGRSRRLTGHAATGVR